MLGEQIVDRPERCDVGGDALIDEGGREPEHIALVLPFWPRAVHPGLARVREDQPWRRRVVGQRVANLQRPQLSIAHQPCAGLRVRAAKHAMAREMDDVVLPVTQEGPHVRARQPGMNPGITFPLEIDDAADFAAGPVEPAGHLLRFVARTRQLAIPAARRRRSDRR